MKTLFPQKVNNRWMLLRWNDNALHAQVYRTFVHAIWEYNKQVRVK